MINKSIMLEKMKKVRRMSMLNFLMSSNPTPALNQLDIKLTKYLNYENGFFIEAGANDGYTQSNTYYFETQKHWKGVLIEAIPELANLCRVVRPSTPVYHCALVADDYAQKTVTMKYGNLTSIVEGVYNDPEREKRAISKALERGWIEKTYDIEVPARTLTSILDEITPARIDLFSLDVEHYELSVLKGLDFTRYRPLYLLVETYWPDKISELLPPEYQQLEQMSPMDFLFGLMADAEK